MFKFATTNLEFTASLSTLKRILHSMGYKYKKVNNCKIIIESPRLQSLKLKFLRRYLQLAEENVSFVFLDETWLNQNGSPVRRWVLESDRRGMPEKVCMSEGKRFTVLHAGGNFGFLEGCELFLDSNIDSRDYHKTMTGEVFKKWTIEQLIPSVALISGKVVVVMDNAPYHSMHAEDSPKFSWKKAKLEVWVHKNKIPFGNNLTKKQLFEVVKPHLPSCKKYVIDELLSKNGIDVLRLPPYHCQYNPIEMVWGFCKTYFNKHILAQPSTKSKVPDLWHEALSKYTPEMWMNSVNHCERLIRDDWKRLMGNESVRDIPPIIISLADSDEESIASFTSESAIEIVQDNDQNERMDESSEDERMEIFEVQLSNECEVQGSESCRTAEILTVELVD